MRSGPHFTALPGKRAAHTWYNAAMKVEDSHDQKKKYPIATEAPFARADTATARSGDEVTWAAA